MAGNRHDTRRGLSLNQRPVTSYCGLGFGQDISLPGKKQNKVLFQFLDQHARRIPRTMPRYAIEKLTPAQRRKFMAR